jgi:integrase
MSTISVLEGASFHIFINSLKSAKTKERYSKFISDFAKWKNVNQLDDLLHGDPKSQKADVMSYLFQLRGQGQSSSSRNIALAAIKHYYEMNDIALAWKPIGKCVGEQVREFDDRPYTNEEIKRLLEVADLKYRAIIFLMISSGVRVGSIPSIKYGHLQKMSGYEIFKISVYKKSKEEYYTFCTPECYSVITEYLDHRRRLGEVLTAESPLFRIDPNPHSKKDIRNAKPLSYEAIKSKLRNMLIRSGVAKYEALSDSNMKGKRRNDVQAAHGLRKFFASQMENADVNDFDNEALMGHKTGLRGRYRKTPEKRLREYLKAIDFLTINEENRLKTKVEVLEEKNKEIESLREELNQIRESHIKSQANIMKMLKDAGMMEAAPERWKEKR